MREFILAIDQGTTGSTALAMGLDGRIIDRSTVNFPQHYPKPGWVEHDLDELWSSVQGAVCQLLEKAKLDVRGVLCIGITNQRETSAVWHQKTGEVAGKAIVWQCRRTASRCAELKEAGAEPLVQQRTGLVLDPYFSATKLALLSQRDASARRWLKQGQLRGGTIDTYLLYRLTGGLEHLTDVTNAARTSLLNIHSLSWDHELLELFGVDKTVLPEVRPSSGSFGETKGVGWLPDGIPITGVAGDQQAALFGQTCFKAGSAKCTFGTGSFILMNTGSRAVPSQSGLLTTVAWQLGASMKPVYALEGGAFLCGAAVDWVRDSLGIIKKSSDIESLAASVPSSDGVDFVPALTGLGAPHWDANARGTITGLTRGSGAAHIARATLDAIALQNADILRVMESESGRRLSDLRVDGGACVNNLLMQIQSDVLGRTLIRPTQTETTGAGASYLAGLGCGIWSDESELAAIWAIDERFAPVLRKPQREQRVMQWQRALKQTQAY